MNSHAAVAVSDTVSGLENVNSAGGLVGFNNGGTVENSYATGRVSVTAPTGAFDVGGLVGTNEDLEVGDAVLPATIKNSYATGAVTGSGNNNVDVGGLVGYNISTIQTSYATGAVTGSGSNADVGGLVGLNNSGNSPNNGLVQTSYATGAVSNSGSGTNAATGGLIGLNLGTVDTSYATGAVSGGSNVAGLVGSTSLGCCTIGTVSNSYWDTQTSGQPTSAGGTGATGLTTGQLQGTAALPAGVTFALGPAFAGGAAGGETSVYPYLTNFFPKGVQAVSGFAYSSRAPRSCLASTAPIPFQSASTEFLSGPRRQAPTDTTTFSRPRAPHRAARSSSPTLRPTPRPAPRMRRQGRRARPTLGLDHGAWQVDLAGSAAGSLSALNAVDAIAAGSLARRHSRSPTVRSISTPAASRSTPTSISVERWRSKGWVQ